MPDAPRVLIAKPGLDGHDRGARVIVRLLREAGFEVEYTGIRRTPDEIAEQAREFGAEAVGLSILSGAHMELVPEVLDALRRAGLEHVPLIAGRHHPAAGPYRTAGDGRGRRIHSRRALRRPRACPARSRGSRTPRPAAWVTGPARRPGFRTRPACYTYAVAYGFGDEPAATSEPSPSSSRTPSGPPGRLRSTAWRSNRTTAFTPTSEESSGSRAQTAGVWASGPVALSVDYVCSRCLTPFASWIEASVGRCLPAERGHRNRSETPLRGRRHRGRT